MSSITGQPAEWIEVSAKWAQQTTVLVLSQVTGLAAGTPRPPLLAAGGRWCTTSGSAWL